MRPTKLSQADRRNELRPRRQAKPVITQELITVDNEGWEERLEAKLDELRAAGRGQEGGEG